jgi:mannobiose 2-epimerase
MIDLHQFRSEVEQEVRHNILPFHIENLTDRDLGGFYGYLSNNLEVRKDAPRSLVQNSRLLWTYSQAYRVLKEPAYLDAASRAYRYVLDHFWDGEAGGLFWMLDYRGQPLEAIKMGYGQAFGIYGLTEYYLATGQPASLDKAIEIYRLLEKYTYDSRDKGYYEGCRRDWSPGGAMRLGGGDLEAHKSMNAHLHILEAYTNLLRAWDDAGLRAKLGELIQVMIAHIVDPDSGHFKLFFDERWRSKSNQISYGHDIEGSWLLVEAAEVLGDEELLPRVKKVALKMAHATYDEGVDADGGVYNEGDPTGITHPDKDWWPQAEAMVGFLNAYQLSRRPHFLEASLRSWEFIKTYIVDREYGEWFWGVTKAGAPRDQEKAGPWKSSYHNSRACFEVMRRLDTHTGETGGDRRMPEEARC